MFDNHCLKLLAEVAFKSTGYIEYLLDLFKL